MATVQLATGNTNGDQFTFTQNGGTGSLSSGSCILAGGSPSCNATITATGVGSPILQATFSPSPTDGNNNQSSNTFAMTVTKATPQILVSCSPSTVIVGSTTSCTAHVIGGALAAGTNITFSSQSVSGRVAFRSGTTCPLSAGQCSLQITATGAGTVNVIASSPSDANDNPASGQTSAPLTISQSATLMTLGCVPTTVIAGQRTTCTVTITGYLPTGIVIWSDGGVGGSFSANPCALLSGSCPVQYTAKSSTQITASYAGDGNNTGSNQQVQLTVNVNEEIQITVANSGPVTSVSLSGCSVSPTSIQTDGTPYAFTASSGCTGITVSLPPPLASSRYFTANGQTSLTVGSCANSCALFSATIYYQVLNTYQVAPTSPATWSASGTVSVTGTALGVVGSPVCSITVSTGAGQFSCQGWSDYGTPATLGALSVSSNQRWATGQSAFTDISGGNQHTSGYYAQVLEDFQYTLVGSSTAPNAPQLGYTGFGVSESYPLAGSQSLVWLDTGTNWSVPSTLAGSTSIERWQGSVTGGAATAGQTVTLTYYHQFQMTFGFVVVGGGTAFAAPQVTFSTFGAPQRGTQGWVDAGSPFNFTDPLGGSTASERWFTATSRGTAVAGGTMNATYYHQYAVAMNFSVAGGGTYLDPRLNFTAGGSPAVAQLNVTRQAVWVDSGSKWSASPLLPNSSPTERWITDETTSGTVTSPLVGGLLYYHQYLETLRYSIVGSGGSPPVPSINYSSLARSSVTPLGESSAGLWIDAGSTWVTPLTLPGAQGERWLSNVTSPVQADSASSTDVQFVHQFYITVGVSTSLGGKVANSDQWKDQGSLVLLNATATKPWSFAYWHGLTTSSYNGTTDLASFTVSGPANETAVFFPGLFITTDGQGAVAYSYGTVKGTIAFGKNATIYPPPGRNVTLIAEPKSVTVMFVGWTGALSSSQLESFVSISSPAQVHANFQTDYTDIRTFAVASIVIFGAACFVFIFRRGMVPKVGGD